MSAQYPVTCRMVIFCNKGTLWSADLPRSRTISILFFVSLNIVFENWAIFESMKSTRTVKHHEIFIRNAECVVLFTDLEDEAREIRRLLGSIGCHRFHPPPMTTRPMTAVKQEEVDTTSDTSGDQLPMGFHFPHMDADHGDLSITTGDGTAAVTARFIKGVDKRATITEGWSDFFRQAHMNEGQVYAFAFKCTSKGLCLIVYSI
uniref:TF-B3 domain-containing protein n=1 Tax=Aegilops tauschii TaxID=37682 RepID=M8BP35_AEGTA